MSLEPDLSSAHRKSDAECRRRSRFCRTAIDALHRDHLNAFEAPCRSPPLVDASLSFLTPITWKAEFP
jgi:hypothetical protein